MLTVTAAALGEQAAAFVAQNIALAAPLAFALCFAESIIVVSLFVPSTIILIALGGVYAAAGGSYWTLVAAAAAGAFLGDLVTFALGRAFKEDADKTWPMSKYPELFQKTKGFVRDYGALSIIGSKFLGFMRPFAPAVAGAMAMGWPLFAAASAASCVLWAGVVIAPGYGLTALAGPQPLSP